MLDLIADAAKLGLVVAFAYLTLHLYDRREGAAWSAALMRRRVALLVAIALVATGIKIFEDVLGHESGPFDEAVAGFVRERIPEGLMGLFSVITVTGSLVFLFPVVTFAAIALAIAKRWFDAAFVALAPSLAAIFVVVIKLAVGRARPARGMEMYADASFPSGHTVAVAAFATALALVTIRLWPRSRMLVTSLAVAWILLVALSRLVLGVHWPTDVLAAACLGAAIPLIVSLAFSARDGVARR